MDITNYKDPHYLCISSILQLLPLTDVSVFFLAVCQLSDC